ncbi:hypothetical protein IU449_27275 [Nocardia higoensis]|uniref:Uncharacterized protein n=1 Tax=Nocardia higoensis TaxID=228599 RepID=A0ABS0DJX1_9NOCA|nr:hypothetical protein [Nocardia higoensis]MBF6358203.1 hypothetical protein [Nocardia higoensis]
MPPRKTTTPAVDTAAPQKSRWAQLVEESTAGYEPKPPYMFDGTNPPTPIHEPVTADQVTALAALIDSKGRVDVSRVRELFEAVCGDSFQRVWDVVGRAHSDVLIPLFIDINDHFGAVPGEKAGADLPGGD